MRRMFSGEPADSHSIQRTSSSETFVLAEERLQVLAHERLAAARRRG